MLSNSVSVIFFFSSRRRHTRCLSDWSSDVCSSDLCYHKEWDYFSREYGIPCIDYIEPKPGIPPTPGHVLEVINEMRNQHIQVLFSTNYYDRNQVLEVAQKTGAKAAIVPSNTNGAPGINTYFDLMNLWLTELARAFGGGPAAN